MSQLERGDKVGEYTLIGQHWDGALGHVWIARRHEPGRRQKLYALRVLPEMDTDAVSRLVAWGCAMGSVDEPTVAQTVDLVTSGPHTAVVSELVVGESLRQVCRVVRGWSPVLSLSSVLVLARSLRRIYETRGTHGAPLRLRHGALDAHRLVVDYEAHRLVMLDAGLTAVLEPDDDSPFSRADIYGLGLLLWEMLTGRAPPTPTPEAPRAPKLPSLKSLGVKSTKRLEAVVRSATAPDPALRYSSLPAFITDLEAALDEQGKSVDVPHEIGRILQQRLQHRVQAMRTLVQRWSGGPSPRRPSSRTDAITATPRRSTGDLPRTGSQDLPILPPVFTDDLPSPPPPTIASERVQALPLVEPLPLSVGLPAELPAPTEDVGAATTDMPAMPKPSVVRALHQLTWLGLLVVVALAATAYTSTEAGREAMDLLFALFAG